MGDGIARRTLFRVILGDMLGGILGGVFMRHSFGGALPATNAAPRVLLRGFHRTQVFERHYRADAAVIFCGVTIFTRRGVGGAHAVIEAGRGGSTTATSATAIALHFVAGSDPARCAGLNRFGILEEAIVNHNGADTPLPINSAADPEFAFTGLITDFQEDNLDQAKKALHATTRQQVKLARGGASGGRVQAWTEEIQLTRPCTWKESADLLATLAEEAPRSPACEIVAVAGPFLAAVRSAALCEDAFTRRAFLHAGKLYSLELRRRPEGEREGLIREENGAKAADFRVFYPAGDSSGPPLRIEYRANSYLKLVFDAEDGPTQSNLRSMFPQEAA
jgi:hypothetical protein